MDVDKNNKNNETALPTVSKNSEAFYKKVIDDMNSKAGISQGMTSMPKPQSLTSTRAFDVNSATNITDLVNQVSNYRDSYTDTCFRRTAPYGGTMPVSFERWLRAVDVASSSAGGKRVKVDVASAIYAQAEKSTQSTYKNLCRMTAEPFPLISSGKASDSNSNSVREQPLIDPQNGKCTASRYARVCLSTLGKIATKWYHGTSMNNVKLHKSIVPLCLLRKTQAWTLGFRTEMRPLNPSELFKIMAKMIEIDSPDIDGLTLQQYFRGPDLGDGYTIFMTNESLMTLYSTGKGSITVVPQITVDRINNRIIFQRPVLDQTSNKLATLFHKKLIDAIESGKRVDYRTFEMGDSITPSGKRTYIKVNKFYGTDEQIIAELMSSTEFQKTVALTNSVLLPKEGEEANINKYEGINYECDLMSIKDTLWMHVGWERENVLNKYKRLLAESKDALEKAKLIDKVTRPRVANFIHACMKLGNRIQILTDVFSLDPEVRAKSAKYNCKDLRDFKCETLYDELIEEGKRHPGSNDYWYEGETFNSFEASEIYKERGGLSVNGEVINILSILFMREKYKNYWAVFAREIANCERMIENSKLRDKEILDELEQYAIIPEFQRKSPIYYLKSDSRKKKIKALTPEDLLVKPSVKWDEVSQPITIYYGQTMLFKSYGVNMNIYHKVNTENRGYKPVKSINCLNTELLALYYNNMLAYFRPCNMEYVPYEYQNVQGILPVSENRRILVLLYTTKSYLTGNKETRYKVISKYMVIEPGIKVIDQQNMMSGLQSNECFGPWIYMDDENGKPYGDDMCVLFLLNGMTDVKRNALCSSGTAKVKLSSIKADGKPHEFLQSWGFVTDLVLYDNAHETRQPIFYKTSHDFLEDHGQLVIPLSGLPAPATYSTDNRSFSTHTEFYLGRTFIGNWIGCGIVNNQCFSHGKRGVIQENRFLYRKEAVSEKIYQTLSGEVYKNWNKLHRIYTCTTDAYKKWKLSDLSDWSIIDKRFGFPEKRPKNQDALDFCDQFFADRDDFNTRIVESPRRTLIKRGIKFDEDAELELRDGFKDSIKNDEDVIDAPTYDEEDEQDVDGLDN